MRNIDLTFKEKDYHSLKSQPYALFQEINSDITGTKFTSFNATQDTIASIFAACIVLDCVDLTDLAKLQFQIVSRSDGFDYNDYQEARCAIKAILGFSESSPNTQHHSNLINFATPYNYTSSSYSAPKNLKNLIRAICCNVLAHSFLYGITSSFNIDKAKIHLQVAFKADSNSDNYKLYSTIFEKMKTRLREKINRLDVFHYKNGKPTGEIKIFEKLEKLILEGDLSLKAQLNVMNPDQLDIFFRQLKNYIKPSESTSPTIKNFLAKGPDKTPIERIEILLKLCEALPNSDFGHSVYQELQNNLEATFDETVTLETKMKYCSIVAEFITHRYSTKKDLSRMAEAINPFLNPLFGENTTYAIIPIYLETLECTSEERSLLLTQWIQELSSLNNEDLQNFSAAVENFHGLNKANKVDRQLAKLRLQRLLDNSKNDDLNDNSSIKNRPLINAVAKVYLAQCHSEMEDPLKGFETILSNATTEKTDIRIETLETEIQTLQQQLTTEQNEKQQWIQKNEGLQAEIDQLRHQLEGQKILNKEIEKEKQQESQKNEQLQVQIAQLQEQLKVKDQKPCIEDPIIMDTQKPSEEDQEREALFDAFKQRLMPFYNAQQKQIDTLLQQVEQQNNQIAALEHKIDKRNNLSNQRRRHRLFDNNSNNNSGPPDPEQNQKALNKTNG